MKPDETVLSLFLFFAPLNPSTYLRCVASIQLLCVFCSCFRYFTTAQLMLNGFLTAQGIPPHAMFDPHRPSESLANLFDFIAREHLHTKLSTIVYVKPAVTYVKDLVKLGKARGLLQKFNATELSDKLTDTVNLEVCKDKFSRFICLLSNSYSTHCGVWSSSLTTISQPLDDCIEYTLTSLIVLF